MFSFQIKLPAQVENIPFSKVLQNVTPHVCILYIVRYI